MWGLLCFLLPLSLAAKTQRALPTGGRRKAAWQIKYVMWGDRRGSYRVGKRGKNMQNEMVKKEKCKIFL
jgi:hypothetical protein